MSWDPNPSSRSPTDVSRFDSKASLNGVLSDNSYISVMNTTVVNMFIAIRDAIHIDLGYQDLASANIYGNNMAFNTMIAPEPLFPQLVSLISTQNINITNSGVCSWGWGCTSGFNTSWAQALMSTDQPVKNLTLPIAPPSRLPVSVIDMVYLCPQYKLKSWGSVLVAVFTGVPL
ncbi:hypothetical protein RhiLY_12277 [Ceratobasidium sp. AG-Ba]|nr:hypothetical protein RhiLY_12277 [Ceratobasidium sp. AG-Ba]